MFIFMSFWWTIKKFSYFISKRVLLDPNSKIFIFERYIEFYFSSNFDVRFLYIYFLINFVEIFQIYVDVFPPILMHLLQIVHFPFLQVI
jgi:hypothetical protein